MRKLALHNQTELIVFAVRMGLLRISESTGSPPPRKVQAHDEDEEEPVTGGEPTGSLQHR